MPDELEVQDTEDTVDPTSATDPVEDTDGETFQLTDTPEAEETEAIPAENIDWDEYLKDDNDEPEPARPQAQPEPKKDETLTWEQERAQIKQEATAAALGILTGAMQNSGKLQRYLQDEPPQIQQFAEKLWNGLDAEGKAQKGTAEYLADIALGRKVRLQKLQASKPTPKSATPKAEPASQLGASDEAEVNSWVTRLMAADPKKYPTKAAARKEVLSW